MIRQRSLRADLSSGMPLGLVLELSAIICQSRGLTVRLDGAV